MLILDTNILIELAGHDTVMINFLRDMLTKYPSKPYITAPSYSEFLYGYLKKDIKKQEIAKDFLEQYKILNTSKRSATILANIKYQLENKGKMMPIFDVLIASIVIDKSGTLVTMDEHFKNIDGLKVIITHKNQ